MNRMQSLFVYKGKKQKAMIGFIIWIIGVILTIRAAMEIWQWKSIATENRLITIILLILTSWIGLAVYYFWGRENLPQTLK